MKVHRSKQYGALEAWVEALPSQGRYSFTRDEAMNAFGLNRKAFNRSASRLSSRNKIARIHGKFYVVVPLEYAAVGVVPADWFIVKLMEHLGRQRIPQRGPNRSRHAVPAIPPAPDRHPPRAG